MSITVEQIKQDIVNSLSAGRPTGDNVVTFTVRELAEATNRSTDSARTALRKLVKAGIATRRRIIEDGASKDLYIIDAQKWKEMKHGAEEEKEA